mmetsp:Transcript_954/g.2194  ORF Transcript_954/g.2194 Transcript_954/m.2194 type:complete len:258 (-) Transcript_954:277-1050(-)
MACSMVSCGLEKGCSSAGLQNAGKSKAQNLRQPVYKHLAGEWLVGVGRRLPTPGDTSFVDPASASGEVCASVGGGDAGLVGSIGMGSFSCSASDRPCLEATDHSSERGGCPKLVDLRSPEFMRLGAPGCSCLAGIEIAFGCRGAAAGAAAGAGAERRRRGPRRGGGEAQGGAGKYGTCCQASATNSDLVSTKREKGPGGSTSLPALLGAGGPGGPATQRRGSARRLRDARGVPAAHPAQRQRRVGSLPAPGRGSFRG